MMPVGLAEWENIITAGATEKTTLLVTSISKQSAELILTTKLKTNKQKYTKKHKELKLDQQARVQQ